MHGFKKKDKVALIALSVASILVPILALRYGGRILSLEGLFDPANRLLVLHLRLPRILADYMVGAGLSVVGMSFQTLVRNPLADPYLFGISSAAAFGYIVGSIFFAPVYAYILSFAMALMSVLFVVFFGIKSEESSSGMVLTGVAISFFFSSIISIMSVFLSSRFVKNIFLWYLGDTTSLTLNAALISFAFVVLLSLLVMVDIERFEIYRVGEDLALSSGVDTSMFLLRQYVLGSLITSIIVSQCGAIGFVGLIMPHFVKIVFGESGEYNLALSFTSGGLFMVIVDTTLKSILYPMEIPVGVITALIGSPFLILLLRRVAWRSR